MTFYVEQSESSANLLKVPFHVFTSNGTAPDTGLSNDSLRISFNGASALTATNLISAVSAGAGNYAYALAVSEVSQLGSIQLSYEQGDFPQHVATIQVVRFDPFGATLGSAHSRLQGGTTSAISLGSGETSTNDWFNGAQILMQYASGNVIANEISDYTGASVSAQLKNAVPIAPPSSTTYWIVPNTFNDLSAQTVGGLTNAAPTALSNSTVLGITNFSNLSGNFSNLTVRPAAIAYSGLTVAVNDLAGTFSAATVRLSSFDYSSAVTTGVGIIEGSAATRIADAVLDRNLATGTDSGTSAVRTARDSLRALRNRTVSDATQIYVYKEDDTTIKWTASKQTTATAVFITGYDPNG